MNRTDFFLQGADLGWKCYRLNRKWTAVTPQFGPFTPGRDGTTKVDIVQTGAKRPNLFFRSKGDRLVPGRPLITRMFRVIATDWQDAFNIIEDVFHGFETTTYDFWDVVEFTIPAKRLIPETYDYFEDHKGKQDPGVCDSPYVPKRRGN